MKFLLRFMAAIPRWQLAMVAALGLAVVTAAWPGNGLTAEAGFRDAGAVDVWRMAEPAHFALASQGDDTTAFREQDAGFSAYYRVPEPTFPDGNNALRPRLNVFAITQTLLDEPDTEQPDYKPVRSGPGVAVDLGSNFAIVKIPMFAALSPSGRKVGTRDITVYYDDRGWVVAYLPAGSPAAGIWRHNSAEGGTYENRNPSEDLEQNLLVLALNEVLDAAREHVPDLATVSHATVSYYHWQYANCDAFVLFSNTSIGGQSDPIRFVVPPAIKSLRASAGVLITSPTEEGESITASVQVKEHSAPDGSVIEVQTPTLLNTGRLDLKPSNDNTLLYEMTVSVSEGDTATGVVMLLYDRPGS